jgi:protein involved in polysaccharide export with SLBB domain
MRKIITTIIFLAVCINFQMQASFAEISHSTNSSQNSAEADLFSNYNARKYILGPHDIISLKVYGNPEFDQEGMRVQPDGKLVLPPLSSIKVSGLTIDELKQEFTEKFKYYLNDPQITIRLDESRPFVVYVTGAVLNPGSYELITSSRYTQAVESSKKEILIDRKTPLLSNVLVAAGGATYDADLEHVKITNRIDNSQFEVDLIDLLKTGNVSMDMYLIPGDNIHIPKLPSPLAIDQEKFRQFASATFAQREVPIKIYGYVTRPGLLSLDPAQSLTINSAIMAAGGYLNDSAYAPKLVYISRKDTSGKLVTTSVNPMSNDMYLLPNDIVYVPEKNRPLIGKTFDYVARVLNPVNTAANSYNNWALMFDPTRYQVIGK